LTISTGNPIVSLAGFVIIGFGCAPIYPCIIHSTPDNFGAENSGAIIGIQMASAYVGSTFIPPLFGLLGTLINFTILPVFLSVFIIIMISMTELTFRITSKKEQNSISGGKNEKSQNNRYENSML
jgi:MFS family permease